MSEPPSKRAKMERTGVKTRSQNSKLVIPIESKKKKSKKPSLKSALSDQTNEFQITGSRNPLLMYSVVKNLAEYLPLDQLIVCRQVCTFWNEVCTSAFYKKTEFKVPYSSMILNQESTFFKFLESKPQKMRAIRFHKFLQGEESVAEKELRILSSHGGSIHKLIFDKFIMDEWEIFLNFIYTNVPKLEELHINFQAREAAIIDNDAHQLNANLKLLSQPQKLGIKKLVFNLSCSWYNDIDIPDEFPSYFEFNRLLNWCPSLTALEVLGPIDNVKGCFTTSNCLRLKLEDLTLDSTIFGVDDKQGICDEISNFLVTQPLKNLTLQFNFSMTQWTKVLSHVPNSLKSLSIKIAALDVIDDVNDKSGFFSIFGTAESLFPCYQNLESLSVTFDVDCSYEESCRFNYTFFEFDSTTKNIVCPAVKCLSWVVQERVYPEDSYYFKNETGLSWDPDIDIFKTFSKMLPNLQVLHSTVESSAMLKDIIKSFPNLIELRILDSSFTRFKVQDFALVGQAGRKKSKKNRLSYQGILSLQGLRHLTLEIDCSLLTDKAVFSGFLRLPELSVLRIRPHPSNPIISAKMWTTNFTPSARKALFNKGFALLEIQQPATA